MQVHALDLEGFCEEEYSLIGIHTALEDYRLAYLLNKNIHTRFSRSYKNLEFENDENKASFAFFNFTNKEEDFEWFLIANSAKSERETGSNQLLRTTETKIFLIPEKKKVDFFIKMSDEVASDVVKSIIHKIKKIEQVITSYSIDKNTLKSKDFLII